MLPSILLGEACFTDKIGKYGFQKRNDGIDKERQAIHFESFSPYRTFSITFCKKGSSVAVEFSFIEEIILRRYGLPQEAIDDIKNQC